MKDSGRELVKATAPRAGRIVLVTTATLIVPPVIAAIFGGLGLAIAVGLLSIFVGLIALLVIAHGQDWPPPPPRPQLPRARARDRGRRG